MVKDKKNKKGPQDRNSNYQMKNGNSITRKKDKPISASAAQKSSNSGGQKGLLSGITKSISCVTCSLTKKLKH